MEASTTRNFSCLGKRRLASGAVVTLAQGGGQLTLENASNMTASGTSEAGCIALLESIEEVLVLRQKVLKLYGTVDEDATLSWSRAKHIDGRHHLVRYA